MLLKLNRIIKGAMLKNSNFANIAKKLFDKLMTVNEIQQAISLQTTGRDYGKIQIQYIYILYILHV